jgi:serine/threonine protein kinase
MNYSRLAGTKLGRFELHDLLTDEGQIVATYRASQPALNRQVALQILNPNLERNDRYRQGFIASAEMMARLEHPNITPVHDYDTHDGLTFIVTRLMVGGSLRQHLNTPSVRNADVTDSSPGDRITLSLHEAANIVRQIGSALEYVHLQGLVHGDPSVANIVFDQGGNAYIADFHVAGFLNAGANVDGDMVGTPRYTAPEKWQNSKASPKTDQYALACIAYEMIAGYPPFEHENLVPLMLKHLNEPMPSPQTFRPEIPLAVNNVLNRALAKNPEDRYPTVMDFAREFEKAMLAVPKHLFISYSRHDKDYAQQVCDYLSHNGFEVWIDSKIEYGTTWFEEIDEAIKNCAAFVPVMTPESRNSDWVRKEILLAMDYKKPIFPLLLEGDRFPILVDIQFADVKGGMLPDVEFHRRLRRTVFGDA